MILSSEPSCCRFITLRMMAADEKKKERRGNSRKRSRSVPFSLPLVVIHATDAAPPPFPAQLNSSHLISRFSVARLVRLKEWKRGMELAPFLATMQAGLALPAEPTFSPRRRSRQCQPKKPKRQSGGKGKRSKHIKAEILEPLSLARSLALCCIVCVCVTELPDIYLQYVPTVTL